MTAPARVFLVVATLAGLCFALATPPIRSPDENGHYLRIASAAASLFGHAPAARGTVWLPDRIAVDFDYFSTRLHEVMRGRPFDLDEIAARVRTPAAPATGRTLRQVPRSQMVYPDLAYLPQAVAFEAVARAGGSFLVSLWAIRLAVVLASVLITVLALMLMPAWARWTSVAVSLLPMAAYMRGSASIDAVVNAVSLLGIAAFLDGARRNEVAWPTAGVALAACLYLAVVKAPHACILLLALLWLPLRGLRDPARPRLVVAVVATIWAATIAAAAWHTNDVAPFAAAIRPDLSPAATAAANKIHLLLTSPLAVGTVFAKTLLAVPGMAFSTIARFGWSDINPHPLLHVLVILWCAGVVYLDRGPIVRNVSLSCGAILLATFAAQVALVWLTIWLVWTDIASPMIQAIQGRHFLPALLCGVLGAAVFVLRPFTGRGGEVSEASGPLTARLVAGGASLLLAASLVSAVLGEFFGIQGFQVICLHELCKPN
jgi:uncharacterized membrane protein